VNRGYGVREKRKEVLKALIKGLHEGADPEEAKKKFGEIVRSVTPAEIAAIEEELVNEGMPREEIHRLCDIHLALFRETLEKGETLAPEGHPIHILMEEHKMLLKIAGELRSVAEVLIGAEDPKSVNRQMEQISRVEEHLRESEKHYLREENVLSPYLQKHGITQPPAIMWMEHDRIRELEKNLYSLIRSRETMGLPDFARQLQEPALALAEMFSSHFYKENNILFPTALKVIEKDEWKEIRRQFDEVGYCCFTPKSATVSIPEAAPQALRTELPGAISFETGTLSKEEAEAILDALPVDITFVDKDDTIRYFNISEDRIFVRTKAVIGRKVQQCHPQKSLHMVNKILESFKDGSRDVAEFWTDSKGRLIHIRYFAVRNRNGDYLGCLEVAQDITDIKKIEGERRLLDWA